VKVRPLGSVDLMRGMRFTVGSPRPRTRGHVVSVVTVCVVLLFFATMVASGAASAVPLEFGSEGEGAGQFRESRGIAVDQESGEVLIADRNYK
jgi:hypothetical protein